MAAKNIFDDTALLQSLKAAQYSPDALRAMNDNLTAGEAASARMVQSLKDAGTNVLDTGAGIRDFKTDQVKNMLAQASRAGMQLDPTTGQPIDPTGANLTAIMDRARTSRDNATGFSDMSGMVDFNALDAYQNKLAGDRRLKAEELRKVAAEKQLRSLDEANKTKADYGNKRQKQLMEITWFKENRNQLTHQLNQEKLALDVEYAGANNDLKIEDLKANIKKKEMELARYDTQLINKENELLANIESTKAKTETEKINNLRETTKAAYDPATLQANINKQEAEIDQIYNNIKWTDKEKDVKVGKLNDELTESRRLLENINVETSQLQDNASIYNSRGNTEGLQDLKLKLINNFQENVAQPRVIAKFKQQMANTVDTAKSVTAAELTALGKDRSPAARKRLKAAIVTRLKNEYDAVIPGILDLPLLSKQADLIIDSNSKLAKDFKIENEFYSRTVTETDKINVQSEKRRIINELESIPAGPDRNTKIDTYLKKYGNLKNLKGERLVNVQAAKEWLREYRDENLAATDLGYAAFGLNPGKYNLSALQNKLLTGGELPKLLNFQLYEQDIDRKLKTKYKNTTAGERLKKREDMLRTFPGWAGAKTQAALFKMSNDAVNQENAISEKNLRAQFNQFKLQADDEGMVGHVTNRLQKEYGSRFTDLESDSNNTLIDNVRNFWKTAQTEFHAQLVLPNGQPDLDNRAALAHAMFQLFSVSNVRETDWIGDNELVAGEGTATVKSLLGIEWLTTLGDLNNADVRKTLAPLLGPNLNPKNIGGLPTDVSTSSKSNKNIKEYFNNNKTSSGLPPSNIKTQQFKNSLLPKTP